MVSQKCADAATSQSYGLHRIEKSKAAAAHAERVEGRVGRALRIHRRKSSSNAQLRHLSQHNVRCSLKALPSVNNAGCDVVCCSFPYEHLPLPCTGHCTSSVASVGASADDGRVTDAARLRQIGIITVRQCESCSAATADSLPRGAIDIARAYSAWDMHGYSCARAVTVLQSGAAARVGGHASL